MSSDNFETKKYSELFEDAIIKIDNGDAEGAGKIANFLESKFPNAEAAFFGGGLFNDIGLDTKNPDLINKGINLLNKLNNKKLKTEKYYLIGNGYFNLYKINYYQNKTHHHFNKENHLSKAKEFCLKALKYTNLEFVYYNHKKEHLISEIYTNLGNTYDELGRNLDALEYYEKALELKSDNPMALGNKGIALNRYAHLMGHYENTIFIDARESLLKALSMRISYPKFRNRFQVELNRVEKKLEGLDTTIENETFSIGDINSLEDHITAFCFENKLHLNLCSYCQRCENSIKDAASINIQDNENFDILANYFDQIRIDYITARSILAISQYESFNLDFVYNTTTLFSTDDYLIDNSSIQLLKLAFKSFADILDKIAHFLNEYLELGIREKDVTFLEIWYDEGNITPNIIDHESYSKNPGLNALFDIRIDLKEGQYKELIEIRNNITHKFLKIDNDAKKETSKIMSEQRLLSKTVELASVVKNSIIYLLYSVNLEEK